MKKKKKKIQKTTSTQKVDRMRDGIRERASTWSKGKTPKRSNIKNQLRNYKDGNESSFLISKST